MGLAAAEVVVGESRNRTLGEQYHAVIDDGEGVVREPSNPEVTVLRLAADLDEGNDIGIEPADVVGHAIPAELPAADVPQQNAQGRVGVGGAVSGAERRARADARQQR